ncbi:hypothetical protein BD779DRAFT_1518193 [Infundibulicybe gibba]|nr:hypothetical protein BD779DRAFT_1518193 [Infundibulicybe gibba]
MHGDVHARALAVHVRNCKISHWSGCYPTLTHHWALHWAPNIECLKLSDSSDINSRFWRIIGGFSKLKTLKLSSVSWDDIPDDSEIDHIAGLRVSSLKISNSRVFLLPQALNPTMLARLECDPNSLDIILEADGSVDTLETLTISYPERSGISTWISVWSLKTILSKTPSLRDLAIYCECFAEGPEITPQDFSALLPNLRSLTCSFPLLAYLAPSGPLVSLTITDDDPETLPSDLGAILGIDLRLPSISQFGTPGSEATAN